MLKQITLAGLASALVLSLAAVTPASANPRGGGFGHARNFGQPGGGGNHPHFATRGYFGHRLARVTPPSHHPQPPHWWHWRHGSRDGHYGVGYYGGYAPAPIYDAGVTAPAPATCNCLTKNYMPDGTVVFADQCTKESAAAAPIPPAPRG
jgi:hypothetical protein